jgi:hypothetical protein
LGGQNIVFDHNDVHGGTANQAGLRTLLTDYYAGSAVYANYTGDLKVEDNTIECTSPVLAFCVALQIPGTVVAGNRISTSGNTNGIVISKPPRGRRNDVSITNNKIDVEQGIGLIVRPSPVHAAIIEDNHISTLGAPCIRITSSSEDQGDDRILGNVTTGCRSPVLMEAAH